MVSESSSSSFSSSICVHLWLDLPFLALLDFCPFEFVSDFGFSSGSRFHLKANWRQVGFGSGMKPGGMQEQDRAPRQQAVVPRLIRSAGPRGRSSRDLVLVKWTAWIVMLGFVVFVAWVLWRLATHEPSPFPIDSGD
jgi:hypothetical protein